MTEDGLTKLNLEAFLGVSGNTQELLESLGISAIPDLSNLGASNNNNSGLTFDPNDPSAAAFYIAQQVAAIEHPPPRKMTSSEKTRSENRERKKRWREQNEERNKDNDLRCRVNKKAKKLFGSEPSIEKTNWIEAEFTRRHTKRKEKERACLSQNQSSNASRANSQSLLPDLDLLATNSSANAVLQGSAINNALNALAKDPNLIHSLLTQIDFDPSKSKDGLNLGSLTDVVPPQPPQPEHELAALQEHNEAHDAAMRQYELERQQNAMLPGLASIDGLQALPHLDFSDSAVTNQSHSQSQNSLHPLISQSETHSIFSALSETPTPVSGNGNVADAPPDFSLSQVMPLDLIAPSMQPSAVSSPMSESHVQISSEMPRTGMSALPMRPRSQNVDKHRKFPYYNKRNAVTTPSSPYDGAQSGSPQFPPFELPPHNYSQAQSPNLATPSPSFSSLPDVSLPPIVKPNLMSEPTPTNSDEKSHALGFPPPPGQKIEFQRSSSKNGTAKSD